MVLSMEEKFNNIIILKCDITDLEVDAIVNAANESLLGGGGVDGAIHAKAGSELLEECRKLGGCKTGEAKITKGYNLKAKNVIHTVAPRWYDYTLNNKEELLQNCYVNSYELAKKNGVKTIAFPCLGMGVFQVPQEVGTKVSIETAIKYSKEFGKIYLVCFSDSDYEYYCEYMENRYLEI